MFSSAGRSLIGKSCHTPGGGSVYEAAPNNWQFFVDEIQPDPMATATAPMPCKTPNEKIATQLSGQGIPKDGAVAARQQIESSSSAVAPKTRYGMFVVANAEAKKEMVRPDVDVDAYCSVCSDYPEKCGCLVEQVVSIPDRQIWYLGFSPKPICDLLDQARQLEKEKAMVEIRYLYNGLWRTHASVQPRCMNSIYLDPAIRESLVNDVEEFVSDTSEEWYNARSAPYRRGYLPYGKPVSSLALPEGI